MAGSSPAAWAWPPRGMSPHALTGLAFARRLAFGIAGCVSVASGSGRRSRRELGSPRQAGRALCCPPGLAHDAIARHPRSGSCCDHITDDGWVYHNCPEAEARVISDEYAALRNSVCGKITCGSCMVAFSNRSISEFKIESACDKLQAQAKGADRQ
jgi:hypothetical protein